MSGPSGGSGSGRASGAQRTADAAFRLLELLVVACLAIMVVMVFGNVVLRYGFNSGIDVSEELSRIVFVWMIFIGAVIGFRDRSHLGVDSLVRRMRRPGRLASYVASDLLMLAACVLVAHGSAKQVALNWNNPAPVTGIPLGVGYAMGVFTSVAIALMLLRSLARAIGGRLSDDELIRVASSEDAAAGPAVPTASPPRTAIEERAT
jgi:TRAP-type C4-dicarboxylate transport system permease small subunit